MKFLKCFRRQPPRAQITRQQTLVQFKTTISNQCLTTDLKKKSRRNRLLHSLKMNLCSPLKRVNQLRRFAMRASRLPSCQSSLLFSRTRGSWQLCQKKQSSVILLESSAALILNQASQQEKHPKLQWQKCPLHRAQANKGKNRTHNFAKQRLFERHFKLNLASKSCHLLSS